MYALFYGSYILFGGTGFLLTAVGAIKGLMEREQAHLEQLEVAEYSGYWNGYGQAWPMAYRNGEEHMLGVCQSLAQESIDMVEASPEMQMEFNQLVDSWPMYALPQQFVPWGC